MLKRPAPHFTGGQSLTQGAVSHDDRVDAGRRPRRRLDIRPRLPQRLRWSVGLLTQHFASIPPTDSLEFVLSGLLPASGGFVISGITISVDPETARAFEQASAEEQRKLRLLLSLRLRELTTTPLPSLQTILDEVGREAHEKGLTSEILGALPHDE